MKRKAYILLCIVLSSCYPEHSLNSRIKTHQKSIKAMAGQQLVNTNGIYNKAFKPAQYDTVFRFYKFFTDGRVFVSNESANTLPANQHALDSIIYKLGGATQWHAYFLKSDTLFLEIYGGGYSGYYYELAHVKNNTITFFERIDEKDNWVQNFGPISILYKPLKNKK